MFLSFISAPHPSSCPLFVSQRYFCPCSFLALITAPTSTHLSHSHELHTSLFFKVCPSHVSILNFPSVCSPVPLFWAPVCPSHYLCLPSPYLSLSQLGPYLCIFHLHPSPASTTRNHLLSFYPHPSLYTFLSILSCSLDLPSPVPPWAIAHAIPAALNAFPHSSPTAHCPWLAPSHPSDFRELPRLPTSRSPCDTSSNYFF